jgi:cytochrome P450
MKQGHETTANAMLYALVNLALCPEIQQRVRNEIDMLFASTPDPTYSTGYPQLRYLHGFMVRYDLWGYQFGAR